MANNKSKPIDGVYRRKTSVGKRRTGDKPSNIIVHDDVSKKTVADDKLSRDIEESLDDLFGDDSSNDKQPSHIRSSKTNRHDKSALAGKKLGKRRKPWSTKKKVIVGIVSVLAALLIALGVYGYMLLNKTSSIFGGSPADILSPKPLQQTNGRTNVLVYGTSEDDAGHKGALLTDSIMVLSVDNNKKIADMFSIPRDLWVSYGANCSNGSAGKINAYYQCALAANNNDQAKAGMYFGKLVTQVTGLNIHYYVKVDYTAIKGITDALGGIDVDVWSQDPRGIYDAKTNFKIGSGVQHLNGEQALILSRVRNSKGGYGLPASNFDREKNQQRIVKAIQKKALSAGVLANPQKALGILDSLGQNVKTNINMSELGTAIGLANGLNGDINSIDIKNQLKSARMNGASALIPKAGQDQYSALQTFIQQEFTKHENSLNTGTK